MNILKALSKVSITKDEETVFKGTVIGLVKQAETGKLDPLMEKPPENKLEILIGGMYDIRMFRDKTTIAMDVDIDDFNAMVEMVVEGIESWGPEEFKGMVGPVLRSCIPQKIEGSYRAVYPDGEVIVDDNHVAGHLTIPMGLGYIHEEIARQERNMAAFKESMDSQNAFEN